MKKLIIIWKSILTAILSSFDFKARDAHTFNHPTEIRVEDEYDWNNPMIDMPEVPTAIYSSNLSYRDPIGYMWSDGIMTATEERTSPIVKKHTKHDPWIASTEPSTFNTQLENKEVSSEPEKNDTYIIDTSNGLK
jgi:hypothetical protein